MVRFKNRYLILSVRAKDGRFYESIGPGLAAAIKSSVQLQHGDEFLEAAAPSLQVAYHHHIAGVAIVRIGRAQHVKVLSSCLKLSLVDYKGVIVKLLKLTGQCTVRHAGSPVLFLERF
eukprot:GHUV01031708.1.p1 GENE.GHUV01031708.1~~GHUV01031708.1.p1  ORF type:complete len:118 (+),score=24.55 GHUV01031708.1:204-557(+)